MTSEKIVAKAVATGVEKRIFGYMGGGAPTLGADGKYQVSTSKVRFDTQVAEDEIDLESGFIMLPQAIPQPEKPADTTAGGGTGSGSLGASAPGRVAGAGAGVATAGGGTIAGTGGTGGAGAADGIGPGSTAGAPQTSVELSFSADSATLYTAWQAMANLADMAGKVAVTVKPESETGFDKSKLNNGVLEPLREANLIQ